MRAHAILIEIEMSREGEREKGGEEIMEVKHRNSCWSNKRNYNAVFTNTPNLSTDRVLWAPLFVFI